ncbi:hypothetical protein DRW07_10455 [Alteromonas sediminis]|uniref:Uncharacterized protein n=1 Tax=Alteromonas sediminis TaxID=2259342 RepID=A0A3N5Y1R2_9ALTE|nr:hypothetical protein [Alteromonas sediminis]RPJ66506.1 hypothetical protein DRW07_10455 [Alteromonas sediminis]
MSTPTTDQHKGWRRFVAGFVVFLIGLALTLSDASDITLMRYLGLGLLIGGFIVAMTGYLPMIWFRLTAAKRFNKKHSK